MGTMSGSISPLTATMLSLMRLESGATAASMPASTRGKIVAAGDLFESLAVERVQVNVEAAQAGIVQRLGLLVQQHGVGGQRQILDAGDARKALDQTAADRGAAAARRR